MRAYLQVACTGLGFDIGEIWWTSGASNNDSSPPPSPPSSPSLSPIVVSGENTSGYNEQQLIPGGGFRTGLKFVQLYTSKSYENRRNELINPPDDEENVEDTLRPDNQQIDDNNAEKHVLSPRLVNAIYQSAQVVWAMSHSPGGLIGRSDIQLQTAVGVPVALDSFGNMCVVVMFSPNIIPSTDDAMEYLHSISQSATSSSIPCLLPVFNESSAHSRQIFALPHSHNSLPHADNELGEGVTARFVSLDDGHGPDEDVDVHNEHHLSTAPKDTFGIPMLPCFAELENAALVTPEESIDIFDEASYGVWKTIMNPDELFREELQTPMDLNFDLQAGKDCFLVEGVNSETTAVTIQRENNQQVENESFATPLSEERKQRLEEFCQAFLGMSVFDIADVWVPAASIGFPDCVQHVMSVIASNERNEVLRDFNSRSANMLIKFWTGAIGRAYSSGNPVWSANSNVFVDPGRSFAFSRAKIQTVLAVPVFKSKDVRPSCVVAFYSMVRSGSVPFVLKFVQQALRLLWDGLEKVKPHESIDENIWQQIDAADLGEMAADIEMQQTFMSKKRRHEFTSTHLSSSNPEKSIDDMQTNNLASSLQQINLPSGETISVPLQLDDNYNPMSEYINSVVETSFQAAQNGEYDWTVPVMHLAKVSTPDGSKRAHVIIGQIPPSSANISQPMSPLMLPSPLRMPSPLSMPSKFPNRVVQGYRKPQSTSPASQTSNLQVPSQQLRSTPSTSPMLTPQSQQIPQYQSAPSSAMHSSTAHPVPHYQTTPSSSVSTFQQHPSPNRTPTIVSSATTTSFAPPVQMTSPLDAGQQNHFRSDVRYQDNSLQHLSEIHPPLAIPQTQVRQPWSHQQTSFQPVQQPQTALHFDQLIQPQSLSDQSYHNIAEQHQSQQRQYEVQSIQSHIVSSQSYQQPPDLTPSAPHPQMFLHETLANSHVPSQSGQGSAVQQVSNQETEFQAGFQYQGTRNPSFSEFPTSSFENTNSGSMGLAVAFCMPTSRSASSFGNDNSSEDEDGAEDSGVPKCCRIDGCTETAVSRRPYCIKHSGNRICEHPGCPKCAQGSTRFCIAHGGGRRCTFPGCDKGARDKFFCAAHGGGKRCSADNCSKSAVGGSSYCTAHGGGRRCSVQGCDKSAQSSTRFCVKHGGGKKCAQDGCEKVARGRTNFCAAHGGGIRCKLAGCNRVAIGKLQLCRTHGGGARQSKKSQGSSDITMKGSGSDYVFLEHATHAIVEAPTVYSTSGI